jgi:hypothetical protein
MADHPKEKQIPLVLIVVGALLYVLGAVVVGGSGDALPTLIAVAVGATIQTVILIVSAFIVAAILNVSFGDSKSAILKFAAASLVAGGVASLIPMGWIIGLFLFLGLVVWLFELEIIYAVVLTVVYIAVSILIGIALASVR